MAPGANNKNTGTVPKQTKTRNNNVDPPPFQCVNPTRRDLQQLNVLADWASLTNSSQSSSNNSTQNNTNTSSNSNLIGRSKPQNTNRTEGNWDLGIDTNRFIPVRPILRRNILSDDQAQQQQQPSTVVSSENHQIHHQIATVHPTTPNIQAGTASRYQKNNIEERLNQIQEYIRITTSLIDSVQGEHRGDNNSSKLIDSLHNLRTTEVTLKELLKAESLKMSQNQSPNHFKPINSSSLDDVTIHSDVENGARPQSVQSIHTNSSTPVNTPSASIDELNRKLDFSNRNMQGLKDQQAQLMRLQTAAKEQLRDMEQIRNSYIPDFNNVETVEQAQSNVANLMTRMNAIQQFIHSQNELCSLLGDDSGDVLAEQAALQNKLRELKNKKSQMEQLVQELQNMNDEATQNFQATAENDLTPTRMVTGDHERIVPMEMTNVPSRIQRPAQNKNKPVAVNHISTNHHSNPITGAAAIQNVNNNHQQQNGDVASDAEDMQDVAEADMQKHEEKVAQAKSALDNKISEINKMTEQLNRLKDMMNTVKLIEQKTGPIDDDDEELDENASESRSPSVESQISENVASNMLVNHHQDPPERETAGTAKINNNQQESEDGSTISSLATMTEGLKEQSRIIAKERERLRAAQADLRRRNETLGEAVQKEAGRLPRPVIPPRAPSPGPAERQQMMLKAELEARKNELENVSKASSSKEKQQMLLKAELESKKKELDHIERLMGQQKRQAEAVRISALNATVLNTPPEPPIRSRYSTPPQQVPQAQAQPQQPNNGSKDSGDSGTGDLYAVPLDTASFQSDSTRSTHVIPPMPDLTARSWKRSMPPHNEPSIGSSANDFSNNSPWMPGLHFNGPPSSNAGPQSPNYPGYLGSDQLSYNPFNFGLQQQQQQYANANNANDPLIIHHFMQTQQMLMNSISQCNQLLWIQQREINSLNNAVVLLQERILNSGVNNLLLPQENIGLHTLRAESTPPNASINPQIAQPSAFNRARCVSEQPQNIQIPSYPNFSPLYQQQVSQNTNQSFSQASQLNAASSTSSQQQILRNNQAINQNNRNIRNMRATNQTQTNSSFYHHQQQQQQHNTEQVNTFMNLNNHFGPNENEANFSNARQNNINATTSSNLTYQNLASSNLNATNHNNINLLNNAHTAATNNESLTNGQIYTQQPCQTNFVRQTTPSGPVTNVQQTTPQALNNQVPPGNRANNYWDNFRSYSRQNLLSSNNSYKSNEEQHQSQLHHQINNPNIERVPQNMTRNINTNNILDNNIPKYQYNNSRNNNSANAFINQLNGTASIVLPDANNVAASNAGTSNYQLHNQLIQQQQQQQHHPPLNQSNSFDLGELEFHTNPINLGVNEFSSKSKTLPKGSGNKKYSIPIRNRDYNSLELEGAVGGVENNNLNRSVQYQDPKSTSKLFEALKENVYHEVTNLIAANESRPHFLIQLFRELQLISSDPLRQRTIQSIQELYDRAIESTIIPEESISSSNVQQQQDIGNGTTNRAGSPQRNVEFDLTKLRYVAPEFFLFKSLNSPDSPRNSQNENSYGPLPISQSTPQGSQVSQSNLSHQQVSPQTHDQEQGASASPDAGVINSIMNEIISAVHAVDYINDSILQKVTNIVFNHVSDTAHGHEIPSKVSRLIINNDDFVRQLNHWNRTDKDEFITNLENYLNNILVECSNVAAGNVTANTTNTSNQTHSNSTAFNSTLGMDLANISESSPSNNGTDGATASGYSGFAIFVDGDLAEADQVCSNDENMEIDVAVRHANVVDEIGAGGGSAVIHLSGNYSGIEESNSEIIEDSESGLWDPSSPVINNHPADDSMNHNPNASNNSQI